MAEGPIIWWIRRDLRLADNPALSAAEGRAVIPLFIRDRTVDAMGAAPKWRLGLGLDRFAQSLASGGLRMILRRGEALEVLGTLVEETGAAGVFWNRLYDPDAIARDREVKQALREKGLEVCSFNAHLLFEPWEVETGQGGPFRVYSPYWRAVKRREVPAPLAAPRLTPPATWPVGERLEDWRLGAAMNRGAEVVGRYAVVGEAAARDRLTRFIEERIGGYREGRSLPGMETTSRLSENLTWGEIGPRALWHAGWRALHEGALGAESFLREVVWREFAYHLMYHTPHILTRNWREGWDAFPWRGDNADAERWRRGRTGEPMVDAAMREMFVTGTMHNRARMVAASYLTKHLLTHWRVGLDWFAECLIDWDPASNALGWQWVAGTGPDAAPFFRVFNPRTQAEKFDPEAAYRHRFVAELAQVPGPDATAFFAAAPVRWGLAPAMPYPEPVVTLEAGRRRALDAWERSQS